MYPTFQSHDLLRVRSAKFAEVPDQGVADTREIRGLLKCYRRVATGTPGGTPVDAPQPPARASA